MATLPTPPSWVEWAFANLPARMASRGLSANFIGNTLVTPMNVFFQALSEAVLIYCQNLPVSPDDALPVLAVQDNMPQYAWETNEQFRQRLAGKWSFWKTAGSSQCIIDQLETAGFNDGALGVTPYILFPDSSWWSSFVVLIDMSGSIGTGAPLAQASGSFTTSQLMNPAQAATVDLICGKFKPADWRVNRIELVTPSTPPLWDDPRPPGGYRWDTSGLKWGGGDGTGGELLLSGSANSYTKVVTPPPSVTA